MKDDESVRLNIGAGRSFIPGVINVDISSRADISLDLSENRLPFENSSVDCVFSYHTLEHVRDYLFSLSEIYRVLKDQGVFLLGVPYATSTDLHLVNPYHLHNFNEDSFSFFDLKKHKGSAAEVNDVCFEKIFHRYHYFGKYQLLPSPVRNWGRRHLLNVVKKIDFGLIAVKSERSPAEAADAEELQDLFDQYLAARVPYGPEP